jgi:hypothetical protein
VPAANSGFASVFAFKHCAKIEHSDKAKNRTQSHKTLVAMLMIPITPTSQANYFTVWKWRLSWLGALAYLFSIFSYQTFPFSIISTIFFLVSYVF